MIPKTIHYIWLSDDPLTDSALRCISSWEKQAPEFKIKRWKMADFAEYNLPQFVKEAIEKKKWAFACDYLRAFVLYKEGGLYLDSDVLMLKDIAPYLNHDFVSSVEFSLGLFTKEEQSHVNDSGDADKDMIHGMAINAAILASVKGHPYLKDILEYYDKINFIHEDGSLHTVMIAPHIYAYVARKYGFKYQNRPQELSEDIYLYKSEVFAEHFHGANENSVLVHMCAGSWRDEEKINPAYYASCVDNLITYLENRDFSKPYLSVIVYCHNAGKYLTQCLESIRRQTFKDFEVIMVDDGSLDLSSQICDAYEKMDPRFKVINKSHEGIVSAYKSAQNIAMGTYVNFVDGNDWISLDMYDDMWKAACNHNADIIQMSTISNNGQRKGNNEITEAHYLYYDAIKYREIFSDLNNYKHGAIEFSLSKVMLKLDKFQEIINKLDNDFPIDVEAVCTHLYASHANSICLINFNHYHKRFPNRLLISSFEKEVEALYKLFDFALKELNGKEYGPLFLKRLTLYFIKKLVTIFIIGSKTKEDTISEYDSYIEDSRFQKILSMTSKNEIIESYGSHFHNLAYRNEGYDSLVLYKSDNLD